MKTVEECVDANAGLDYLPLTCPFGMHIVSVRAVAAYASSCASFGEHLMSYGGMNCPAVMECLGKRECRVTPKECGITDDDVVNSIRMSIRYKCRGFPSTFLFYRML
jgi:hypothetical protein